MAHPGGDCQNDDVIGASAPYPRALYLVQRLREHGLGGSLRRVGALIRATLGGQTVAVPVEADHRAVVVTAGDEVLGLQPGDVVEVKSEAEIRATLDANGKHKGMGFMPEMYRYCGQRRVVFKRVERILMETTGELRRVRNTVLLQDTLCDGWNGACDRACFYFWREAWLRRVEAVAERGDDRAAT